MIVSDRLAQVFIKEIIQVLRDPRLRFVIFVTPIIQLFVLSYAISTDVHDIRLAVCDFDRTPASRAFISGFEGSRYFRITRHVASDAEAQRLLDREQVQAFLTLLPGFSQALTAGRTAYAQIVVDGTDASIAQLAMDYAGEIAERFSRQVLLQRRARDADPARASAPDPVALRVRAWYNDNLESTYFYVPGMLAVLTGLITLMLTSSSVVREREIGTLEQLLVTPIRSFELIIGKTMPFACISLVVLLIVLLVALVWFKVPLRGSSVLLLGSALLYIMSMLGVGLFISTTCRTQQQAMMSNILFFMPSILLSGFVFPIDNMPRVVQWITYVNPMRYFIEIVRSIFLKGSGVAVLWPNLLVLFILGLALLALATSQFRKTVA
jgi:ABC-2 type transport system permease protein